MWSCLLAALLVLGATVGSSAAEDGAIGIVKIVEGAAFVVRQDHELSAREGLLLFPLDVLRTRGGGRIGVILRDNTRLSLGPNSELRIDRFAFQPAQGNLGLVLRMTRGVVAYVSGKIAALEPAAVRFETPVSVVGVRGTAFAVRIDAE